MSPRFRCPDCKERIVLPPGRRMRQGDPCPNPDCPGMAPNGRHPGEAKKHRKSNRQWREENS